MAAVRLSAGASIREVHRLQKRFQQGAGFFCKKHYKGLQLASLEAPYRTAVSTVGHMTSAHFS